MSIRTRTWRNLNQSYYSSRLRICFAAPEDDEDAVTPWSGPKPVIPAKKTVDEVERENTQQDRLNATYPQGVERSEFEVRARAGQSDMLAVSDRAARRSTCSAL